MKVENEHSSSSLAKKLTFLEHGIFYCFILLLPTQLGKHFWPQFSVVSGLRVDYLSPTLYLTDILLVVLFLVWFIRALLTRSFSLAAMIKQKQLLFLFLIVVLLSSIFSQRPALSTYGVLKICEYLLLGLYVAQLSATIQKRAILLFLIPMLFESILAISQLIKQRSLDGVFYWLGERTFTSQTPGIANASLNGALVLRPYGTFPHPNVLAGYLLIGMVLVISSIKNLESRTMKGILIVVLFVSSIALFLTLARTAIILFTILGIVGLFTMLQKKRLKRVLLLLTASFLLLLAVSPLGSRFASLTLADEAVTTRLALMSAAIAMIRDHLWLGVGPLTFLVGLPAYYTAESLSSLLQPVHNIFLLVTAEIGLLGLAIVLVFLWKTIRGGVRKYVFIFCVVLILGLFDHYFLTIQQGQLLLSFVLGLCWSKQAQETT